VPADFLRTTPYAQLAQFPRYLKAMRLRAERARKHPAKDAERAVELARYVTAVAKLLGAAAPSPRPGAKAGAGARPPSTEAEALRWLVEEFRVSLFAQELGTAEPVSAKKLDRLLAELPAGREAPRAAPAPKPIVTTPVPDKKMSPLKEFGALDKLFPR